MNVIKRIAIFIKKVFAKHDEIKEIEKPKIDIQTNEKDNFIDSLKKATISKEKNKKIEVLTCEGDGLGIQKKISY